MKRYDTVSVPALSLPDEPADQLIKVKANYSVKEVDVPAGK